MKDKSTTLGVVVGAMAMMWSTTGCGGSPDSEQVASTNEDLGVPVVGNFGYAQGREQAESVVTVSNVSGQTIVTSAFNDDTQGIYNYISYTQTTRTVYPGASLMGWATSVNAGASWTYQGKVTPNSEYPILWGDPAITTAKNNQAYVFLTNLAVHQSRIPSWGYISGYLNAYISGACIARSANGGFTFSIAQCVNNNYDFYDGSSIIVTDNNVVFAAFQDVTTSKIDVWRASTLTGTFSRIGDPFPGYTVAGHPRMATWNNYVYLIAPIVSSGPSGNQLAMNKANSYGNWGTTVAASQPGAVVTEGDFVTFSDRFVRAGPQYAIDAIGTASSNGNDHIRIAFTSRDQNQNNKMYIETTVCTLAPVCNVGPWNTKQQAGDQFDPALAAFPGFYTAPMKWMGSYWSRTPAPTGNQVSLMYGSPFVAFGLPFWPATAAVGPQVPCSTNNSTSSYWGDYHQVKYLDLPNNDARFIIPFSDSSQGCNTRWTFTANHLHVSSTVLQ